MNLKWKNAYSKIVIKKTQKPHQEEIVDSIFTLIYAHFNAMMLQILHDSRRRQHQQ